MAKKSTAAAAAAPKKAPTKSEIYSSIAEATDLSRKQVSAVFDELSNIIQKNLKKNGPGAFTVPGLLKLTVVRKEATKARKGVNPFTKQEQVFKAKPARNVVKIRPLKNLKDFVK